MPTRAVSEGRHSCRIGHASEAMAPAAPGPPGGPTPRGWRPSRFRSGPRAARGAPLRGNEMTVLAAPTKHPGDSVANSNGSQGGSSQRAPSSHRGPPAHLVWSHGAGSPSSLSATNSPAEKPFAHANSKAHANSNRVPNRCPHPSAVRVCGHGLRPWSELPNRDGFRTGEATLRGGAERRHRDRRP